VTSERPLDGVAASLRVAALLTPRRLVHILYFGFALAALLTLSLMVPGQTTRAPLILISGAALWAATAGARYYWERRAGNAASVSIEPAQLFLVVLTSTYIVFSFDLTSIRPQFSPTSPDALPGLLIDSHAYFVLVFLYLLVFIGWYGSERGRLIETALAVQVLLLSLMFETFLFNGASVPALVLMAVALALIRALPWEGEARPVDRSIAWLALPLLFFLAVAAVSTSLGAYPYVSLTITTRMAAMAFFALMLFDGIREDRQRWLIWLAMTAPAVTQGALVTIKVLDIARVLGVSYAFGNRIELASGVEPNPLGLSLAIGILLVAGALPRVRTAGLRAIAIAALALLLPALIVAYSVPSLMGLAGGLAALTVLYALKANWRAWRRPATFAAPAGFVLIGIIVIAMYVVPTPTRNGLKYTVDDPTTGRSRVNIWDWSIRDFKQHPLLGAGPAYYRGRTRYVPAEFPFRDVTKMLERRRLLGDEAGPWRTLVLTHPHNLILSTAEGMGIVGLLALGIVGVATVAGAIRVLTRRDGDEWWFTAFGLALVVTVFGWSMTALGLDIAMLPLAGWLGLGFVAIALRTGDDRTLTMPRALAGAHVRRGLALAAGLAVLLMFVVRPVGSMTALKIGRDRLADGNVNGAERPFTIAASLEPFDATPRIFASFTQLQYGKTAEGLASLKDADARQPESPVLLTALGDVSWLMGDTDAAERYYRRSIASDRWEAASRDPYSALALLKASQGKRDEAAELFADGFFVNPASVHDSAWLHAKDDSSVSLDDAYVNGGDPRRDDRLSQTLSRRLQLFAPPASPPAPSTFSITDAFDVMESRAHAELPQNRERGIEMLDQIGLAYHYAGLDAGARRVFSEAVALDPGATYIRYDLAQAEMASKHDDDAIVELTEVVRLARTSTTYDLRLGFAERDLALIANRQKRYNDAIVLMSDALAAYRWGYLPYAYVTLADAYKAVGQPDKAQEFVDKERFLTRR
jgi:O-antigen ligase/tetratricopeptide (TPR) repeat protein